MLFVIVAQIKAVLEELFCLAEAQVTFEILVISVEVLAKPISALL